MTKKLSILNLLFAGMLLFDFSCATTSTTELASTKVDKQYGGGSLKSVMVVGFSANLKSRKIFENAFVKKYESHGVKSVSSLAALPAGKKLDKALIKSAAERLDMEHIFVTYLLGIDEKTEQIPIAITGSGRAGIYIPTRRYDMPGMDIKETRVKLESRLYELKTERLIWSATSESFHSSFDSASAGDIIGPLCEQVMKSLKEKKLLK